MLFFIATILSGQQKPFLFTTIYPSHQTRQNIILHYDAAYGEKTFEPFGGDKLEQNFGLQAKLSSPLILSFQLGLARNNGISHTMYHAELAAEVLNESTSFLTIFAGGGFRREYSGTNVLLARFIAGKTFSSWLLSGNLLLEKPFAVGRDELDLITTFGAAYTVSSYFSAGIEFIGQDLEGFWDPNEAEGGAKLFAGPTLKIHLPQSSLHLTLGGGPILRATQNSRTSSAFREITGNGFVIRTIVSLGL